MLLFMFGFVYLQELLKAYNIPMDIFSTVFCLFNFGITGKTKHVATLAVAVE